MLPIFTPQPGGEKESTSERDRQQLARFFVFTESVWFENPWGANKFSGLLPLGWGPGPLLSNKKSSYTWVFLILGPLQETCRGPLSYPSEFLEC